MLPKASSSRNGEMTCWVFVPDQRFVKPRKSMRDPRVTTRNESPYLPIGIPFTIAPRATPRRIVRMIATNSGSPASFVNQPRPIPHRASIEPIERSNPPASMTNVSPSEATHRIDELVIIALMFSGVRNRSWVSVKNTSITTSSTSTTKNRCRTKFLSIAISSSLRVFSSHCTCPIARRKIAPSSASCLWSVPATRPACMTTMRSHRVSSSGASDELMTMLRPASRCASRIR
ncbi:unannotated protein [freshwater metagenome]|uniref:Unannotated protein n=1 Tax=freshwater metagenome TaxID=449393 RepID=A0A6J6TXQ2_9ZZZZ